MLNQAFYACPACSAPHHIFGSPARFRATAAELGVAVLGELPVLASVSESGDAGVPLVLRHSGRADLSPGEREWTATLDSVAGRVLG